MRKIDDGAYLDESGRLWIEADLPPDPFDPPGTPSRRGLKDSKFTYLDVPTFGLFGAFWKNNPLQFATAETAQKMLSNICTRIPVTEMDVIEERVAVGPFKWEKKLMLRIWNGRYFADLCAGLEAAELARDQSPAEYYKRVIERIRQEWSAPRREAN